MNKLICPYELDTEQPLIGSASGSWHCASCGSLWDGDQLIPVAPPQDLAAEQRVLGAMLRGVPCPNFLHAEEFIDDLHQEIFHAINSGTLDELSHRDVLACAGGPGYLAQLRVRPIEDIEADAQKIADCAFLREAGEVRCIFCGGFWMLDNDDEAYCVTCAKKARDMGRL